MAMMVQMADGGGSGKKKEKTPATIVTPSGKVIKPTTTTPTTGGSTTHVSSSGNTHGGSSGSFGTPVGSGAVSSAAAAIAAGAQKATQAVTKATDQGQTPERVSVSGGVSGGGGSSSGNGGGGASVSASASSGGSVQPSPASPQFQQPEVNPELRKAYEEAMSTLERMKGETPTYGSQYDEQIKSLYDQIVGRQPFKYDSATDPLYQQYVQDYTERGQEAMRDTMGKAASLTGGYGSSYAQAVGQQAYDSYLRRLGEVLPEMYGMALDTYNAEGDALQKQLQTTAELESSDYARYLDRLNQYNRELALAQADADTAYARMIDDDERTYSRAVDDYKRQLTEDDINYERRQDYYNRLVSLMGVGYNPTAEDYANAGITPSQGAVIRQQYLDSIKPASSGGGGYVSAKKPDTTEADNAFLKALTDYLSGSGSSKNSVTKSNTTSTSSNIKKKATGNGGR